MAAAAKSAGSDDFGSDSFRQPLDLFLASCRDEAELTTFGRILISKMLAAALANRIELHRWSAGHPAAAGERIVAPWVIVGLPRTGTSLLSNLLGLDPMNRNLLQWEAAHLIPPATLEEAASDPRIARTAKELDGLFTLNPPLRVMHPFGATLAQECVSLFMYDVRTLALETQAHVPAYARWLEQADMAPAYAQHRSALQALQSAQPTERWVLKTPNHLWDLDALRAAYPDARIVWTHRDPAPVVTSLASLANAGQRPGSGSGSVRSPSGRPPRTTSARDRAGAGTSTTRSSWPTRSGPSAACTPRSTRRSAICTPDGCGPSSSSGPRTPSAATPTTRPTSDGPTRAWPRSSPDTPSGTTSPPPHGRGRAPTDPTRHRASDCQPAGGVTYE
jgi:hypothetical protein